MKRILLVLVAIATILPINAGSSPTYLGAFGRTPPPAGSAESAPQPAARLPLWQRPRIKRVRPGREVMIDAAPASARWDRAETPLPQQLAPAPRALSPGERLNLGVSGSTSVLPDRVPTYQRHVPAPVKKDAALGGRFFGEAGTAKPEVKTLNLLGEDAIKFLYRVVSALTGNNKDLPFFGKHKKRVSRIIKWWHSVPGTIQSQINKLIASGETFAHAKRDKFPSPRYEEGETSKPIRRPDFRNTKKMSPATTRFLYKMFQILGTTSMWSAVMVEKYKGRRGTSFFNGRWNQVDKWSKRTAVFDFFEAVIALDDAVRIQLKREEGLPDQKDTARKKWQMFMQGYDS